LPVQLSPERLFKTLHSWLGVLILPWILLIGLTGLYLNHWELVNRTLSSASYDEAQFDYWPAPQLQGVAEVINLASTVWPDPNGLEVERTEYHGRDAWSVSFNRETLIVDIETGHFWIKTSLQRKTYDPTGTLLHSKTYWNTLFKSIHEYGWFNSRLGTWLADITATAMVLFGLSGVYLFTAPRLRRWKNRQSRRRAQIRNTGAGDPPSRMPSQSDTFINS
jgi:hypothetical protein